MEIIRVAFEVALDIMQQEVSVLGFTMSLWNLYVYGVVVGIIAWVVWRFILND